MTEINSVEWKNHTAHAEMICFATFAYLKVIRSMPQICIDELRMYQETSVALTDPAVLKVIRCLSSEDYMEIEDLLEALIKFEPLKIEFDISDKIWYLRLFTTESGDKPDGGLENELDEDMKYLEIEVNDQKALSAFG